MVGSPDRSGRPPWPRRSAGSPPASWRRWCWRATCWPAQDGRAGLALVETPLVGTGRLRRLVAVEIAVPAGLAVLVGLLSGSVAAVIAAPRLPLVDLSTPGPPLDLGLEWWPIWAVGAGAVLAIMIIAAVGAVSEIRTREIGNRRKR